MTTDAALPGKAAEPVEPTDRDETMEAAEIGEAGTPSAAEATAAETQQAAAEPTPDSEAPAPSPVPAFGLASAATDPAALAAIEAEQAQRAEAVARRQRRRRNALRWFGAVVVTLGLGGGTAFALTLPQRTDLPGLGTAPDGRYTFPQLSLPALPAGQPAPSASENSEAEQHLADIRKLLLPRPLGASPQNPKSSVNGWIADPSPLFIVRDSKSIFGEFGLRHTAAEGWKTSDGATTTIYLLQFADGKAAAGAQSKLANDDTTVDLTVSLSAALTGVPQETPSHQITPVASLSGDYTPVKTGGTLTTYGSFLSGDIIAVVIQSGPASLPFPPFQQVMTLQTQLLQ